MRKSKNIAKRTILYGIILSAYVFVLNIFDMNCPFSDIVGIKCPTCGVSRAIISLLKMEFSKSINFHPLAVPLVVSVWICLNAEFLKYKKVALSFAVSTIVLNFILYLFKVI